MISRGAMRRDVSGRPETVNDAGFGRQCLWFRDKPGFHGLALGETARRPGVHGTPK
jgi:hypothetical protein